ncbi:uncharacterized protein LOC126829368 isoform X2 [Patella vulgata]|uniref:uncharacterized protein LOC126829368 isoform X2 n=1 Tax=Patella vulgata TaxID=6465 RepID=UPI0024A986D9|nr:uncharacterized protein LOC126829368 isoform X2 [Patella vulgata]
MCRGKHIIFFGLFSCFLTFVSPTSVYVPKEIIAELGKSVSFGILFVPFNDQDEVFISIFKSNGLKSSLLSLHQNFTGESELKLSSYWTNRVKVGVIAEQGLQFNLSDVTIADEGRYGVNVLVNNVTMEFQTHIETIALPAFSVISVKEPAVGDFKEGDVANITCSGAAGRPLGTVYIVKRSHSPVFVKVDTELLTRNYSQLYNGSYIIDYTFSHVMDRSDNDTEYGCEILPGSPSFSSHLFSLSNLVPITVDYVEAARLTISPSQNLQAGATSLTLRCSPVSNAVYTTLYSITINKRTMVQNSQTTNMAVINGIGTKPGTGITPPKYTVTGNYDITQQPTQGFLQIIINNPDCNDAAEYQCITAGQPTIATNPGTLQEDKNVTVQSNPVTAEMFPVPEKVRYSVGENIEITCQGDVGNPEKSWSWESRSIGDSFFNPIRENITKGTVDPPTPTRCGYYSRSILNYYVGQDDNGLVIRCKIDNSELHSDNKTIFLINAENTDSPRPNTGDDSTDNAGMIAGIVVAVIVVIVIVIIVVIVVLKKRKQTAGKDYDTHEDRMKSQTNPHMTPDTLDHDRTQNNEVRGRVNKSMEDSPNDRDRRPYTIQTNGGRTNQGMDQSFESDDAPRDIYLAEDGTDIRGSNAMLGSAV